MQMINTPYFYKIKKTSDKRVVRYEGIKGSFLDIFKKTIVFHKNFAKEVIVFLDDLELIKDVDKKYKIWFELNEKNLYFLEKKDLDQKSMVFIDSAYFRDLFFVFDMLMGKNVDIFLEYDLFKLLKKEDILRVLEDKKLFKKIKNIHQIFVKNDDIWDVFFEKYPKYFYIDKGKVYLSKRWQKRDRFLFTLDLLDKDKEFIEDLKNYHKEIFLKDYECAYCEHFSFCKGFFKFEDKDNKCLLDNFFLKEAA